MLYEIMVQSNLKKKLKLSLSPLLSTIQAIENSFGKSLLYAGFGRNAVFSYMSTNAQYVYMYVCFGVVKYDNNFDV